jgi:hypothetical protein
MTVAALIDFELAAVAVLAHRGCGLGGVACVKRQLVRTQQRIVFTTWDSHSELPKLELTFATY